MVGGEFYWCYMCNYSWIVGILILVQVLPHVVAKCEVNYLVPFCDIVVSLNPNYLLISIMKCL